MKKRGRDAVALMDLGLQNLKDEPLLRKLAELYAGREWVLVTSDDAMPLEHAAVIAELNVTVATIDTDWPLGPQEEEWKWETVQRWAHKMAAQVAGSIRRYSPTASRQWTPRRPRRKRR